MLSIQQTQKNYWKTLQMYSDLFEKTLKDNAPSHSGDLINSIKSEVSFTEQGNVDLEVSMLQYGSFIDEGVNGISINRGSRFSFTNKRPPLSSLENWAKSKGINKYALQQSLFIKGIKPQKFIEKSVDDNLIRRMADDIAQSVWTDFEENIKKKK